jgi:hypothetical protein
MRLTGHVAAHTEHYENCLQEAAKFLLENIQRRECSTTIGVDIKTYP